MGQLVLYLLAQAMGTLGFAYYMGTVAMRRRSLANTFAAAGMYMVMVAALVEVAADRLGWRPLWLAADLGLVAGGVGLLGASVLARTEVEGSAARLVRVMRWAVPVVSVGCAVALAALAGLDDAVVDHDGLRAEGYEGGRSHLTTAGWALGAPLALGVASLILVGSHDVLAMRRLRAVGLWAGGVLLMLWPFDMTVGGVTLSPFALLLGIACTYIGIVPAEGSPTPSEGAEGGEGPPVGTSSEGTSER